MTTADNIARRNSEDNSAQTQQVTTVTLPGGGTLPLRSIALRPLPLPGKYVHYLDQFDVSLPDRVWPSKRISASPIWCSVDLRDGNQALINPLSLEQKLHFFQYLLALNIKQIEIGFPSASSVEFEFTRCLIENNLIPADVIPQVLTQSREHLIQRTFESLQGSKQAIVHLYNSTSELQRRVVYQKDQAEIAEIAVSGVRQIKQLSGSADFNVILEYSPESFTGTELTYARDVCRAVIDTWEPSPDKPMILNLPSTVEMATPNVYADQIEWMCRQIEDVRSSVIVSVHPHNDRGTAIASAELAVLAGADRVEGTLFGNGERTGNVDLVTLALNLFSQGVDPGLNLGDVPALAEMAQHYTELPIPERHPYAGKLVFTAFSGSHQDAIRKGLSALRQSKSSRFEVPYLAIDPADIGRAYEPLVRINSQSGKGGVAFVLESQFGYEIPKKMHVEVSSVVQALSEKTGREVLADELRQCFIDSFVQVKDGRFKLVSFSAAPRSAETTADENPLVDCVLQLKHADGSVHKLNGSGNGPIDACRDALIHGGSPEFKLLDYSEHALQTGSDAQAAAYIQVKLDSGRTAWGAGQHASTTTAAVAALISALNRSLL